MEAETQFFQACDEQFSFLKRYDFKPKTKRREAGTFIRVYQNHTTAVEAALEWPEQYLSIRLCRLVEGKIQDNPVIIRQSSTLDCFNLENLLLLTEPDLIAKPEEETTSGQMEETLRRYAGAVEKYASDILSGDFKMFSRLEAVVKERAGLIPSPKNGSHENGIVQENKIQEDSAPKPGGKRLVA